VIGILIKIADCSYFYDISSPQTMTVKPCAFCTLPESRIIDASMLAMVVRDAFPVSPGHTLVIPKRHVGSFFDLTELERQNLLSLLDKAKLVIDQEFKPDGYNIGINDGPAAGQTVPHLHIHLIPRYNADLPDPRGGVRWVIPTKADYWTPR
jgi:diadenosine tetraphosphate (Ap4A) HIT family hydrolase